MPITTPTPPPSADANRSELELRVEGRVPAAESLTAASPSFIRRFRWRVVTSIGILVVGVAAAAAVTSPSDGGTNTSTSEVTIRAVEAQQRDLVETTDLDGTLVFADVRLVTAGAEGMITATAVDGVALARGDVIYEVNASPVTVFFGDVPFYRSLSRGSEGDDVLLLEQNLAALGHHATEDDDGEEVDTGFTVNGEFDRATANAVRRWQAAIGVEETGVVRPGDVVVVTGPATVSSIDVEVGDRVQPGFPVASLNVNGTETTFHSAHAGEIELQAGSGEVSSGSVLYTVDELPILAIVTTGAFDRELSERVEDGDDVRILEQLLVELGYDADGDLDVDEEFDDATTEALTDFEEDLQDTWDDVNVDGVLSIDEFVIVEPGTRVDDVVVRDSTNVAAGSVLFTSSTKGNVRIVNTAISVADQEKLVEGAEVDVEFPDGSIATGVVAEIASSSTTDPTNPSARPTLAVEIALPEVPPSTAGLNELDVEVKIVDELAVAATVVPASALVATLDGGFAVEVVTGSASTQFIAVDPGMFADGFVEVTGIEPGTAVVVPS